MTDIICLNTLTEFTAEVFPAEDRSVRLNLTEVKTTHSSQDGVAFPVSRLVLSLQGWNYLGELVWLVESHPITKFQGKPGTPIDTSIQAAMHDMVDHVSNHLTALGYQVRPGSYALPNDIKPIGGQFDCVRWQKNDDDGTFIVVPLPLDQEDHDAPIS